MYAFNVNKMLSENVNKIKIIKILIVLCFVCYFRHCFLRFALLILVFLRFFLWLSLSEHFFFFKCHAYAHLFCFVLSDVVFFLYFIAIHADNCQYLWKYSFLRALFYYRSSDNSRLMKLTDEFATFVFFYYFNFHPSSSFFRRICLLNHDWGINHRWPCHDINNDQLK